MSRIVELAWAAGFFDGEGSTSSGAFGRSIQVTVPQVDRRPLDRFAAAVGELNAITLRAPKGPISRKPIHIFRVYSDRAIAVIRLLWPHLSCPKQDQALAALMRYGFRSVSHRGGLSTCARGHELSIVGRYVDPDGHAECAECRRQRRERTLPRAPRLTAIEAGVGIRQYVES